MLKTLLLGHPLLAHPVLISCGVRWGVAYQAAFFSAGTPFGCVEFFLPRLKSVNQLLEVRVLLLFNSEVLQSRDLIFFVQTYSASVNYHQSWAAPLQQFFPSWSNSFSNRNFSYCSWLYLYSISPFPLTFGCFIRGLCLSETFLLLENSAISPSALIFPNSWSLIWMWFIFSWFSFPR